MATFTTEDIALTGLEATMNAANAGGDKFTPGKGVFLFVKNGDGSDHTVTVDSKVNCDQGSDHDSVTTVTAGEERFIGPFEDTRRWGDPTTKLADITYDAVTSVTVAVVKLP